MTNQLFLPDDTLILPCDVSEVSDGYHTFNELYDHRCILFIALQKAISLSHPTIAVWYSLRHSDDSSWEGWFIAGLTITKSKGSYEQITYHLPLKYLYLVNKTKSIEYLEKAPEYDGHTSKDVLDRLVYYIQNYN